MRCAFCGFEDSRVLDSRPVEEGRTIRRRRECLGCGRRFTTYERMEELPLIVVKNDNHRELFSPSKLLSGLIKACDKRSVPLAVLEDMVDNIEKELRNTMEKEVYSKDIGEMVMQRLRDIDEVAYVRFASVYRKFKDISTFMEELEQLQKEKQQGEPTRQK